MGHFVIHDDAGTILRSGKVPDGEEALQAGPGELMLEIEAEPNDSLDLSGAAPRLVKFVPPLVATPLPPDTYFVERAKAYPPVQDQLDMLWKAMDAGVLPKVPEFYERIEAVKKAFPKDEPAVPTLIYAVEPIN